MTPELAVLGLIGFAGLAVAAVALISWLDRLAGPAEADVMQQWHGEASQYRAGRLPTEPNYEDGL